MIQRPVRVLLCQPIARFPESAHRIVRLDGTQLFVECFRVYFAAERFAREWLCHRLASIRIICNPSFSC